MTETITIRLRRPKSEIQARAKPNVSAWVNDLIDHALGSKKVDWDAHYKRLAKHEPRIYASDEVRKANR
jgi:hypothetical protein